MTGVPVNGGGAAARQGERLRPGDDSAVLVLGVLGAFAFIVVLVCVYVSGVLAVLAVLAIYSVAPLWQINHVAAKAFSPVARHGGDRRPCLVPQLIVGHRPNALVSRRFVTR